MSLVSISTANWIAIIQILVIVYVVRYYYKYFTRQSPLPGPFPLPLIGNIHQVGLNPAKYAKENHEEFGDMFEILVGSKRFVFLSHASLIDKIYIPSTKSNFFTRLPISYFQTNGMQHGLLFNNNYQSWKRNRKFVVQSLMSSKFLRQFTRITQSLFNENENFWDKKEHHIDFAKWIKCFTTDITLQTVTRKPSYCLTTYSFGEEHSDPIKLKEIKISVKFFHAVQTLIKSMMFQICIPEILRNYFPGFYNLNQKYKRNTDWLNETILDIIKKRRIEIEKMSNDEKIDPNLIDVLLTLNTPHDHGRYVEDEAPMTDQEICSTLLEVSVAGTDTTGNTFCFVIWLLTHHPKVLGRFRGEVKEILGDDISRQITYEDLEKFVYLDAIIKESARVIPLAPLSARTSTQESVIGGKQWEANTTFFIHHEQIHKSPDCWKDPEQFIPERFLKESDNEIVKNSFTAFGGGVRICPGRHMAMVELKTLLILLYRKYDVELVDKISKKPKIQFIGLNNCSDMKVILRPRKGINM